MLLGALLAASPSLGQTLYWDGGTVDGGNPAANANGGAGTWNNALTNWDTAANDPSSNVAWTSGANAVFGGAGGSVILGAPIDAHSLTFNANNYVLSGNTLTLSGAGAEVVTAAGVQATISSVIAGSNGLIKSGSGFLTLNAANTLTGGITVNGGRLIAQAANSLNGANNVVTVNSGAALQINHSNAFGGNTAAANLVINNGGNLWFANQNLTHDITATGGTIVINDIAGGGTSTWTGNLTLTADTTVLVNNTGDGDNLVFAGNLTDTGANRLSLVLSEGGELNSSLLLTGTNSFTGGITVNAGQLFLTGNDSAAAGAGNVVTINGGIVRASANAFGGDTDAAQLVINNGGRLRVESNHTLIHDVTLTGGTAFLDGIGNATWNGTAVLTADTQLQLGVGGHTLNVTGSLFDNGSVLSLRTAGGEVRFKGGLSFSGGLALGSGNTWFDSGTYTYGGDTVIESNARLLLNGASVSANSNIRFEGLNNGHATIIYGTAAQPTITMVNGAGGGQLRWNGTGGFYALAGQSDVTVNLGGAGATLTWNDGLFVPDGHALILGTNTNDGNARQVDFQNGIDLSGGLRQVRADIGNIADHAVISGVLTGTGGLHVIGGGLLELTNTGNDYSGATVVGDNATSGVGNLLLGASGALSPNSNLQINGFGTGTMVQHGGYILLDGSTGPFTLALGSGAGEVQWTASGGFGAIGAPQTVNIGGAGATLVWGSGGFVPTGSALRFGGNYANSTINWQNGIDLGAIDRVFNVNEGVGTGFTDTNREVNLNGVIQGSGGLLLTGSGDLALNALNTYTGDTYIGGSNVGGTANQMVVWANSLGNAGVAGSLGAGATVVLNSHDGGLIYTGGATSTNRTLAMRETNGAIQHLFNRGTGALVWTGNVTTTGSGLNTLRLGGTFVSSDGNGDGVADDPNIIAGVISNGSGTTQIQGSGGNCASGSVWRLTGANTFTGALSPLGCTFEATTLGNAGSAGSVGASSLIADYRNGDGTLRYVGAGETTNRSFWAWGNSRLESSGTGPLVLTSTAIVVSQNAGFTHWLGGTNTGDNKLAATLVDSPTPVEFTTSWFRLGKEGPGLWALVTDNNAQANAYAGMTRIFGGALRLDNAGAITGGLGVTSSHGTAGSSQRSSLIRFEGAADGTGGVLGLTAASGGFFRNVTTAADAFINNNGTTVGVDPDGAGPLPAYGLEALNDDNYVQGVRWFGSGGFAAWDGTQVVNMGGAGAQVTWNSGGFVPTNHELIFGYATANGTVDFQNAVGLVNATRTIRTVNGTAAVDAIMSGVISGTGTSAALAKQGTGTLALTAPNTYAGMTTIHAGTLQLGNGGSTGTLGTGNVAVAAGANIAFNRNNAYQVANTITGPGTLIQSGTGTTQLSAANNAIGATLITAGTLQVNAGSTLATPTVAMTGTSTLTVIGTVEAGVATPTLLSGDSGANTINVNLGGTLRGTGNLGDGSDVVNLAGTLNTGAGSLALGGGTDTFVLNNGGVLVGVVDGGAGTDTLQVNNTAARILDASQVLNFELLNKSQAGLLTLTGDHNFSTGTSISGGELRIGNGGISGTIGGGPIVNNGALSFNRDGTLAVAGVISGTGSVTQMGPGTTVLSGNNTYTGSTNVNGGTLIIDGLQSGGGQITVASGATLGGNGTAGGPLVVQNGGTLAPGSAGGIPGSLTVAGSLTLNSGSALAYDFGQANTVGGPLNDHTQVNGNLRLDGTLDMTVSSGGTFAPGFYRVFTYTGALDNQGLALGPSVPSGVDVDTATNGQVNLLNTGGVTLTFWDGGTPGGHFDDVVQGGNGAWQSPGGNVNWTDEPSNGSDVNASWTDAAFAVFQGSAGTVTVDNAPATVTTAGMQFRVNGYEITGEPLTLVPYSGGNAFIRVGEGAPTDAGITATISAELTGAAGLTKTDGGRLILTAANSYAGATQIEGGAVQVAAESALGIGTGLVVQGGTLNTTASFTLGKDIALNGVGGALDVNGGTTLTAAGTVSGVGGLVKTGDGALVLAGSNIYAGGTSFNDGVVSITAAANLGTGPLIFNGGTLQSSGLVTLAMGGTINAAGGTIDTLPGTLIVAGNLAGAGALTKTGVGTLTLSGSNSYGGGTNIAGGSLQLGDGGTSGSITGDVANNGQLLFNRSDLYTFEGVISGTGAVAQIGSGTTILTGANTYLGLTNVARGTLLVNGDQSGATGATRVRMGATLGGTGIVGGDVSVDFGGTLAPGGAGDTPGSLTINGNLTLEGGATLAYNFGQPNVVGGPNNDHTIVKGDLDMQGANLDVSITPSGTFGPGVYRVITYEGALLDDQLTLGMVPVDSDLVVDTATDGQVNLVNRFGATLTYWDGAGNAGNATVDGGDGVWQASAGNNNWTDSPSTMNQPWSDGAFAIFQGTDGLVTVDNDQGTVTASGMQFLVDGYEIAGEPLTLVPWSSGANAIVRVGSGAPNDVSLTTTISAELTGTAGLTKTDGGRLILTAANSYTGATVIEGGVIQIAAEAALGTNDSLVLRGGTLNTTTSFALGKDISLELPGGALDVNDGTTLELTGTLGGPGELRKTGTGTLLQSIAGADMHTGQTTVAQGTLLAGNAGVLSTASAYSVLSGATLDVNGFNQTIASLNNAGEVRIEGAAPTVLTVTGNYVGNGGTIYLNATLGDDASSTDQLVVQGDTSGTSILNVANLGGAGAPTVEGIKVVDVGGVSAGTFTLDGDYVFEGDQAVVGGAYAYRLYQNGVTNLVDGDWYLRSSLIEEEPLYQAGVPLYEAYANVLQSFQKLETLQQRMGNRSWQPGTGVVDAGEDIEGSALWGRIVVDHKSITPDVSTAGIAHDVSNWRIEAGADSTLNETESGKLIGGLAAFLGTTSAAVSSAYGDGGVASLGYGLGAGLTHYGSGGFYLDGQARVTGFSSTLSSATAGLDLVDGNKGFGYALSLEAGQKVVLTDQFSLTPQAQLAYSSVHFDDFTDVFGADVSLSDADSLVTRIGLSADFESDWENEAGETGRTHVYGIANLYYELLEGSDVDVAGTSFVNQTDPHWGGVGLGGSVNWADDKYSIYGEVLANASLGAVGESYSFGVTGGMRVKW